MRSPPVRTSFREAYSLPTVDGSPSSCGRPREAQSPPTRSAALLGRKPAAGSWASRPDHRRWRSTTNWRRGATTGDLLRPRPAAHHSMSTLACPRPSRAGTRTVIDTVVRVPGRLRARASARVPDGLAADIPAACAAYETRFAMRVASISRSWDRHRRAHRVQRAGVPVWPPGPGSRPLTRQTRIDQRPLLRRRRRIGAHALPDPGTGDHHGGRHLILVATGRSKAERAPTWSRARSVRCGRRRSCNITRM